MGGRMAADDIVIVGAARTPMGGLLGSLAGLSAPQLGAVAIEGALSRAGLAGALVEEAFIGSVLTAGVGQAPARQAALRAGLPVAAPCTTVGKVCGSGMQATILAHDALRLGRAKVAVAGGMESMSGAPYLLPRVRAGMRLGHGRASDHIFVDGLEDAETGRSMGLFAQDMADRRGLSRAAMDDYAVESLQRSRAAMASGALASEIVPVTVPGRRGDDLVCDDEQPLRADPQRIAHLAPAFRPDGTITAANASSISDGASALLLTTQAEAERLGLVPLARIAAHATHARHPSEFTIAPAPAIRAVLAKAGWSLDEVDAFEINEAFAMVSMLAMEDLELPHARVNLFGGACAQGHPIGSTGCRIIVTLLNVIRHHGMYRGVASLCIGGGEATAVAIERLT